MDKQKKLIFSVIAGVIHQMTIGSITKMGNLSVYYFSYLRKYDPTITLYYGILMMPISTFCLTLSVAPGAILERKFGSIGTIIISTTVVLLSTILMYFGSTSLAVGYISTIINGLGCGLSFLIAMKNACLYSPEKKGMIAAIVMSFGQLGGPIFNLMGESIINPNNIVIAEDDEFFPIEVGENFFNYLRFLFVLYPVGTILTLLCFYKYEEEDPTTKSNNMLQEDSSRQPRQPDEVAINRNSAKYKADLKKIFKTKRLYIIASIYFFSAFLFFLVMGTFKTIGSLQSFDTNLLKYSLMVAGVFLCVMGPLWGHLYDKLKFKKLLIIVNGAGIVIGILLCLSLMNEWFFAIMVIINAVFFVGMMSIFNPHVMKVYTLTYTMEIAGVIAVASGVSNLLGSIFAFCVTFMIDNKENAKYAYIVIFIFGSVFNLVSIIIGRFEKDEMFQFDDVKEKKSIEIQERPEELDISLGE